MYSNPNIPKQDMARCRRRMLDERHIPYHHIRMSPQTLSNPHDRLLCPIRSTMAACQCRRAHHWIDKRARAPSAAATLPAALGSNSRLFGCRLRGRRLHLAEVVPIHLDVNTSPCLLSRRGCAAINRGRHLLVCSHNIEMCGGSDEPHTPRIFLHTQHTHNEHSEPPVHTLIIPGHSVHN